jgi:SpoVK/Ycf46/Vps4 family AAA+-type ATPase
LLNRWIMPLERRVDFLTLHNGKKIEVPFEQLVVFSTNLNERDLVDDAFLRRMGYRASIDPPSASAYVEIFKRVADDRSIPFSQDCLDYVLSKYAAENRLMKSCEPRDLFNRVADICRFEERALELTPHLIDLAWKNYFGSAHGFAADIPPAAAAESRPAAA